MPLSLETSFVCWAATSRLTGSVGHVIVGGDERYEQRLLDQLTTHLGNAAWIEAGHIDVQIFEEEVVLASRRTRITSRVTLPH